MPHFITDKCIGCSVCEVKCPTNTIWGTARGQYYIHPERCIDCSVCGIYCPVDAIQNQHGDLIPRVKPKEIPKAEVIKELCTGCEFCVDICPFECIHMIDANDETVANHYNIAFVDKNKCGACRLCESVCDKDAIVVPEAPTQLKTYLPDFVVAGTGRCPSPTSPSSRRVPSSSSSSSSRSASPSSPSGFSISLERWPH